MIYTPRLVCDDNFNSVNAESACNTLGYSNGGTYSSISIADRWSEDEIPFLKDDVNCTSATTNFLSCPSNDWGDENCDHNENVLITCFESGYYHFNSSLRSNSSIILSSYNGSRNCNECINNDHSGNSLSANNNCNQPRINNNHGGNNNVTSDYYCHNNISNDNCGVGRMVGMGVLHTHMRFRY